MYPSSLKRDDIVIRYDKGFLPPLQPAILSALTPKQHNVKIINDALDDIRPHINDSEIDLVGITAMTSQAERAYQIADDFMERGVLVVMGGIHPTVFPEEAKQHSDSVVIGEAESIWGTVISDFERFVVI